MPIVVLGELGRFRKVQRHDEGRAGGFGEIGPAPFLAAGDDERLEAEFLRELRRAVHHHGAAGLEDELEFLLHGRTQRVEGGIERRTFSARGVRRVVRLVERVVLRVEERLAHGGDHAHERSGEDIGTAGPRVHLEGDVLEDIGIDDGVVRVVA